MKLEHQEPPQPSPWLPWSQQTRRHPRGPSRPPVHKSRGLKAGLHWHFLAVLGYRNPRERNGISPEKVPDLRSFHQGKISSEHFQAQRDPCPGTAPRPDPNLAEASRCTCVVSGLDSCPPLLRPLSPASARTRALKRLPNSVVP